MQEVVCIFLKVEVQNETKRDCVREVVPAEDCHSDF